MRDVIYNILVKYYGRAYGYQMCESMANFIATRINDGEYITRGDIMNYIWMNTTGGTTADAASTEIQAALPHLLQDTHYRSYKGRVS